MKILFYLRRAFDGLRAFVGGTERTVTPLPKLPEGWSWVTFKQADGFNIPGFTADLVMLVMRDTSGILRIPTGPSAGQTWEPTDGWTVDKEFVAGGNA
jgi:hypothetical protein